MALSENSRLSKNPDKLRQFMRAIALVVSGVLSGCLDGGEGSTNNGACYINGDQMENPETINIKNGPCAILNKLSANARNDLFEIMENFTQTSSDRRQNDLVADKNLILKGSGISCNMLHRFDGTYQTKCMQTSANTTGAVKLD